MTNIFKIILLSLFTICYASNYNYAFKTLITYEGIIYHDNPKDPGGPTKYGWTLKAYQKTINQNATKDTIQRITETEAQTLYKKYWWEKYGASKIKSKKLATELFLAQVNMGAHRPNKVLQEMTNDICDTNLSVDGVLGSRSIFSINNCKLLAGGYPYYLHLAYKNDSSVAPVWSWAKNGLRNRIFHHHK